MGVIIGMDPHKRSAAVEVIDERGNVLAADRYGTDKIGYAEMLRAAGSMSGSGRSRDAPASADTSPPGSCRCSRTENYAEHHSHREMRTSHASADATDIYHYSFDR